MWKSASLFCAMLLASGNVWSQTNSSISNSIPARLRNRNISPVPVTKGQTASIISTGPNSRTWLTTKTNFVGTNAVSGQGHVIELATGMHYWNGQKWTPSVAAFEETTNGFVARQTQHKIHLHPDIAMQGAVKVTTRDGLILHSTPLGIGLFDAASGNFLLIGQITNSIGKQTSSNQVIYPNAFNGVCANIVYTLKRGSFEQDVVFTGNLDPTAYGFPADTTRIQIITELFTPPTPAVRQSVLRRQANPVLRAKMASPDLIDQTLGFGEFNLGRGYAYLNGSSSTNLLARRHAPVGKTLVSIDGRTFLVESIDYKTVQQDLQSLPNCNGNSTISQLNIQKGTAAFASLPKLPTATRNLAGNSKPLRLADSASVQQKGFVVDYIATVGGSKNDDFTFRGDITYFVQDYFYCYGNVTMEEGTVVKYAAPYFDVDALAFTAGGELDIFGGFICTGTGYHPVILTASDDDTIGQSMQYVDPRYTGNPVVGPSQTGYGYGFNYLTFQNTLVPLSNMRILFASTGIWGASGSAPSTVFNNIQFVKCGTAFYDFGSDGVTPVTFNNCLLAQVATPLQDVMGSQPYVFVNCSFDRDTQFEMPMFADPPSFYATNCIFCNMQDAWSQLDMHGANNGFFSTEISDMFGVNPAVIHYLPFAQCEAGGYYLLPNTFQHMGTSALDPAFIAQMQNKTTQPPIELPFGFYLTGNLTLFPQNARFVASGTNAPDLGYHYDAVDYTVQAFTLDQGANLTLEPGTVVGVRNDLAFWWEGYSYSYLDGIDLYEGGTITSHGTPQKPCSIVDMRMVQEGPFWLPNGALIVNDYVPPDFPAGDDVNFINTEALPPPVLDFRFTRLYTGQGGYQLASGSMDPIPGSEACFMNVTLRDCELHGGGFYIAPPSDNYLGAEQEYGFPEPSGSLLMTNNLFDRVVFLLAPDYWFYDNTGDLVHFGPYTQITAENNLFHGGILLMAQSPSDDGSTLVMVNNLFDQTMFNQEISQGYYVPMQYSYNAYWPADDETLNSADYYGLAALAPTLDGNGTGDVILTNAPPYQRGPLGNYYLPPGTPLYQAGSATADQLGFYHYTTTPDQTKEAANPISIGLHYLAADTNGNPLDSDGDGIPDYVENWHGDGVYANHTDSETDWQNQYTVAGVFDPTNAVYDDVDLSGNGLAGRIKKALGLAPLDMGNPLIPQQITTWSSPGICSVEIPINYSLMTNIGNLHLVIDGGQSGEFQSCKSASDGNCLILWNTTFDFPIQHIFQPQLNLYGQLRGGAMPDPTILNGAGLIGIFSSTNALQFDPFFSSFDSSGATLFATTPSSLNSTYTIDLSTPSGEHIKTITNSTTNGKIVEHWDLTDDNGQVVTNDIIKATFNVPLPHANPGPFDVWIYRAITGGDGNFTVAYAWDVPNQALSGGAMWNAIQYGVVDSLFMPVEDGGGGSENPYLSEFNIYSGQDFSGEQGDPGHIISQVPDVYDLVKTNLRSVETMNFYWDGHGSPTEIGDGPALQISIGCGNVSSTLKNEFDATNGDWSQHPFRFVFLNACETANNTDWAHAFGIPANITSDDLALKGDPQAFIGWVGEPRAPDSNADWDNVSDTYAVFFNAWMSGDNLQECIDLASSSDPYGDGSVILAFPLGMKYSFYKLLNSNNFHLQIYGYKGITRTGYDDGF